jgi:hypothetical protein
VIAGDAKVSQRDQREADPLKPAFFIIISFSTLLRFAVEALESGKDRAATTDLKLIQMLPTCSIAAYLEQP